MNTTIIFLRIISIFSLVYFFIILAYSGSQTSFLWFWPGLALFSFFISRFIAYISISNQIFSKILIIFFWIAILLFTSIEIIIFATSHTEPPANADYILILGAQVRGTRPSRTLQSRIQYAADYMKENTNTIAICCGGQGAHEEITEALAIKRGLMENQISEDRILLEEKSTNTVENINYGKELLPNIYSSKVLLITSDFHAFRAKQIGKKQGLANLSAVGSKEFMPTTISYYVREFFAILKDFFLGNI